METVKTIHIVVATGLYPPDIGGPATYARMLEENLPAHGFTLSIVTFGAVRHLPKVVRHLVYAWRLFKEIKKADIVYALDPVSVGLPTLLVTKFRRKPFYLRVAGDFAWEQAQLQSGVTDSLEVFYQKRFSYGLRVRFHSFIESFVTKRAAVVIIPCEYLRKVMVKWGVAPLKINVVYSALQPISVSQTKEAIRSELSFSGKMISSAGRLVPNKGFVGLIKVFAEIAKQRSDVSLSIIGDGPQEEELKRLVEVLEIKDRVHFMGRLVKEQLGKVVKGSDLFVLNTEHEGFSHQLLEVMDLRVPIITTNAGGNPELIEDGKTGFLVPFNDHERIKDSILTLLDNAPLSQQFSAEAKERTNVFEQGKLIGQLVEILKSRAV